MDQHLEQRTVGLLKGNKSKSITSYYVLYKCWETACEMSQHKEMVSVSKKQEKLLSSIQLLDVAYMPRIIMLHPH